MFFCKLKQPFEAVGVAAQGWTATAYATSKIGVTVATRLLARDYPEVSVDACCPGWCATDMASRAGVGKCESPKRMWGWATCADVGLVFLAAPYWSQSPHFN